MVHWYVTRPINYPKYALLYASPVFTVQDNTEISHAQTPCAKDNVKWKNTNARVPKLSMPHVPVNIADTHNARRRIQVSVLKQCRSRAHIVIMKKYHDPVVISHK